KEDKESSSKQEPESKYSKEELLAIFDTLMFENEYSEPVKVGKGCMVTFRTMTAGESNEVTKMIDSMEFNTILAVQNFTNVLNLSDAIKEYNGKDISSLQKSERYEFVKKLPEFVIAALSRKHFEFNSKVVEAVREGEKNF